MLAATVVLSFLGTLPGFTPPVEAGERPRIGVLFWHDSPNDRAAFEGIRDGFSLAPPEPIFEVVEARGDDGAAREALAQVKKNPPDLVLMDIVLPDMEGSEAVRLLNEDPLTKDIPVIFLSGIISREEGTARPEINVGGRLYRAIAKPFTLAELLGEIKRALEE